MTQLLGQESLAATTATTATPAPFIDAVDAALTCTEVRDLTHDVKSFTLQLPGAPLRHLPGQYLTFTFPFTDPLSGQPVERCYSISSVPPATPADPASVTITVKKVPGGPVSTWLHERFGVGDRLSASGPYGVFSHQHHPAARYLFCSAGSGITPLMSMLRAACATGAPGDDTGAPVDIVFVHSARTPADLIFREELTALGTRAGIRVVLVCEDDAPGETWHGPRGRLTLPLLRAHVPDLAARTSFTCGPPPYMESVRGLLEEAGVGAHARHEETFLLGGGLSRAEREPGAAGTTGATGAAGTTGTTGATGSAGGSATGPAFTVEFRRSGRVIECAADTTLLDGALAAGIGLPSSCEEGVCGTCKLQLLCGSVDMRHGGGIRPREIAEDKILPCCSTPLDDIVLDA